MAKSAAPKRPKYDVTCRGCRRKFTAGSPNAVWCSKTCRNRVARATAAEEAEAKRKAEVPEHDLVVAVRAELKRARKASTVDGLLAVHLALAVASAESAGKVGPVDRLRVVLAAAVGKDLPAPDDPPAADEPDELDEIQRRRDERAARAATG